MPFRVQRAEPTLVRRQIRLRRVIPPGPLATLMRRPFGARCARVEKSRRDAQSNAMRTAAAISSLANERAGACQAQARVALADCRDAGAASIRCPRPRLSFKKRRPHIATGGFPSTCQQLWRRSSISKQAIDLAEVLALDESVRGIHRSSSLIPSSINSCRSRSRARVRRASTAFSEIPSRSAICR